MMTTLLNCRVKCALKYLAVVIFFLLSVFYLRSVSESSSSATGHNFLPASNIKSIRRPNDLFEGSGNVYKNSKSLVEKLRPKLITRPPGEENPPGAPIWNDLGVARNQIEVNFREEGYKVYAFNTLVSSRLDVHRALPDTRHKACHNLTYDVTSLPSASVVICYYHEEFRTLLRTIHSVIDRTPKNLLREIILVNDQSDIDISANITEHLKDNDLQNLVKVVTPPERLGLIRARIFGSRHASGEVLVFLDSHIEANVQWLEPLLHRVKETRTVAATPIIDIIDADTFEYKASPLVRGGFNWGLNFRWDAIPREELKVESDYTGPFKSPTMAGGLFAIDRDYFRELGEYDPGLDVWGGENLELSFRLWMCGGSLEIVPCSRIGHVFRKRRPYGAGSNAEDTMIRNSLRVAHVWMDEYIQYYFQVNPHAKDIAYGNVTDRIELRQKLKCNNFQWYLNNVYPDLLPPESGDKNDQKSGNFGSVNTKDKFVPWDKRERNYEQAFVIKLSNLNLCIQSEGDASDKKSGFVLASCNLKSRLQVFYETDKQELVLAKLLCLDAGKDRPRLMKCHELGGSQEWKFRKENRTAIYNMAAGLCLVAEEPRRHGAKITMEVCSNNLSYIWNLIVIHGEL